MEHAADPFALPQALEPDLLRLNAYWSDLARGENSMPFADDVNLSQVPELSGRVILVSAFENPERFRFEHVGERIVARYGQALNGAFSDEVEQRAPLEKFTEQCSATVGRRAPTYYRSTGAAGCSRLLLPTWGEGHIMLLLGAVAEPSGRTA